MNVKLLRRIQRQFREFPLSCDMQTCDPESEPLPKCGCIAHFAHIFGGKEHDGGFWYGQKALGLSKADDAGERLFFLDRWPKRFREAYQRDRAEATIARISRFIATKGAE